MIVKQKKERQTQELDFLYKVGEEQSKGIISACFQINKQVILDIFSVRNRTPQ